MREEINNRREVESEIDIQELVLSYLHYWWVIVLCVMAMVGIVLAYTHLFVTPIYRAGVTVYVNNSVNSGGNVEYIASGDLSVSQKLVNTYVNIIKSDTVLQKVSDEKELPYTAAQLRRMITASQVDSTEIFDVFVSHPNPQMAAVIANAIAEVAPGEIANFVEGSSTKIIDYAKVPYSPSSPNYTKNAAIGFVLGFVISIAYLTIRYLMDVHINMAEDLDRMFGYPVLGQIPDITQVRSKSKGAYAKYAEEAEGGAGEEKHKS